MDEEDDDNEVVKAAIRIIVSYDVRRGQKKENVMIHQHLFGRRVAVRLKDGRLRRYRYSGSLETADVVHLGQSVLMMREKEADAFTRFLHGLKVPYTVWRVWCRL